MSNDQLEEALFWKAKVDEQLRGGQLDTIQKAATAWTALFGSLLGIFGVVAFAGGLQSIDDLTDDTARLAKFGTLAAAVALGVATYFAAKASGQLFPTVSNDTTWQAYRTATLEKVEAARYSLKIARVAGLVAVVIVLFGSAVILLVAPAKASPPVVIVKSRTGEQVCGRLERDATNAITVEQAAIAPDAFVTVVTKCPDKHKN
jgi:hypothetical protein